MLLGGNKSGSGQTEESANEGLKADPVLNTLKRFRDVIKLEVGNKSKDDSTSGDKTSNLQVTDLSSLKSSDDNKSSTTRVSSQEVRSGLDLATSKISERSQVVTEELSEEYLDD